MNVYYAENRTTLEMKSHTQTTEWYWDVKDWAGSELTVLLCIIHDMRVCERVCDRMCGRVCDRVYDMRVCGAGCASCMITFCFSLVSQQIGD